MKQQETYSTPAIILDRQPFREVDSRVSVFSLEKGRIDLVARGTKKFQSKLAAHLEPFTIADLMVVRGRQFDYVGSAFNKNTCKNIKGDLEKIMAAGQMVNIFRRLVRRNDADRKIFFLLENALEIVDTNKIENYKLLVNIFVLQLLDILGYRPELYQCVVCGQKLHPLNNFFNIAKCGIVCDKCRIKSQDNFQYPISDSGIKILRIAIKDSLDYVINIKFEKQISEEVSRLIALYYQYLKNSYWK